MNTKLILLLLTISVGNIFSQNVNIPDTDFKNILVGNLLINTDGDTEISIAEATAYSGGINVSNQGISDLTGIEAFTELIALQAQTNNITTLDLSQNTKLTQLLLEQNDLGGFLDFSMLTELTDLKIHTNANLIGLNIKNGNNSNMSRFQAYACASLTCVQVDDVSYSVANWASVDSTAIFSATSCFNSNTFVNIPDTDFKNVLVGNSLINTDGDTEISIAEATAYSGGINVSNQGISDLTGIEAFTELIALQAQTNNITTLDLSQNTKLTQVLLEQNDLGGYLDFSMLTELTDLKIHTNANLARLNIKNGNNSNMSRFHAYGCASLTCVQVDDVSYSVANWASVDSTAIFSATSCLPSNSWTGTTSNNWHIATNWSAGTVPTITEDVTIPAGLTNYPTSTTDVYFNDLTIEAGATYIPEGNVNIGGTINTKINIADTNWHLIAPPVVSGDLGDFITNANHSFATGTGTNIGLATYDNNATTPWSYLSATATGTTSITEGMAIKLATAGDITFQGTVNQSGYSAVLSSGSTDDFSLIGNPFTAYVNSNLLLSDNSTGVLGEQTIWLWNGTSYQTLNMSNTMEIAPGQGFFVKFNSASTVGSTVDFSTANRSHQNTNTFLRQEATTNFELFVNNGTKERSTKVYYRADKTTGFDNGYDSSMFGGASTDLAVYTELLSDNEGQKLAIQTLPNDAITGSVIPVGVLAAANDEVTFSVASVNLPEGITIYLEDRLNNEFINLSEASYKTTIANKSEGVGRFYIHTAAKSLSANDEIAASTIGVYQSSDATLTISGLDTDAEVSLFSVTGKEILSTQITSKGNSTINLPSVSAGVYLVKVATGSGVTSKKITLK